MFTAGGACRVAAQASKGAVIICARRKSEESGFPVYLDDVPQITRDEASPVPTKIPRNALRESNVI